MIFLLLGTGHAASIETQESLRALSVKFCREADGSHTGHVTVQSCSTARDGASAPAHPTSMEYDQKSHTVTALWALSLFVMKRKPSERNEGLFIYLLISLIRRIWLNYFPHRVHFSVGVSKPIVGVSLKTKGSEPHMKILASSQLCHCLFTFRRERCEAGAMINKISFSASRGNEDKAQALDVFILY